MSSSPTKTLPENTSLPSPSAVDPGPAARPWNRRGFIGSGATALAATLGFPTFIPASALGRDGATAPSNRITLGVIGCGPQGRAVLGGFLGQQDCKVIAVCDVKADQLDLARNAVNTHYQNQDCKTHHDLRELTARNDIDACLIATPDHWHAIAALAAVNSGKDVYLEKPLGVTLEEGRMLRASVQRAQRIFQFGTQQRSSQRFRMAAELVRNGRIGKLRHINAWAPGSTPGGSRKPVPVPDGLDYDLWLGPVPSMPYTEHLCADDASLKTWWFNSKFTLGFISGWGIHPLDIALWGAGNLYQGSVTVEGRGNFRSAEGACDTATIWEVDYQFSCGVSLKFVGVPNGGNNGQATSEPFLHGEEWAQRYRRTDSHGTAFEGDDGWIHVDRGHLNFHEESLAKTDFDQLPATLIRSSSHQRNFLDSVRSRAATISPVEEAVAGDALCHIADLAIRLGRKLTFDIKSETFANDPEANLRLKARPMRAPWQL